jgi:DNA-binding FrmR family transcriptional regulator
METNKNKALIGLKKARTLLDRVINMAEEDDYCINIMQQNLAVIGLLKSANEKIMENHLGSCFKNAMASASEKKKDEMIEEILTVCKMSK